MATYQDVLLVSYLLVLTDIKRKEVSFKPISNIISPDGSIAPNLLTPQIKRSCNFSLTWWNFSLD